MNILLGAQRFVLYNYSVTPEVSLVLSGYVKEGLLELVQWDIPVKDIHYFGQNVIINDCLYKHLHVSRYLAYSDVDELIMPQKHKTWMALIQSVRKRTPNVGSIAFRNTFFGTNGNWRMDTKGYNQSKEARLYRVTPLLRVWRDKKILPAFSRTKQIVIPERVRSVRIHLVDKHMYRKQFEAYVVSPKDGLLYHYRWVSGVKEKIKDDRLRTYSDMLLSSVKRRHFQFVTGKKV
ncbi:uncharacterized protein LOC121373904 [Gigantopelta aegis]|uniref:uncharacterized protein LOC121373904 n=1 Tax=Gigantopelta aegis TaxID=1735272 RepID=UPI001B88B82B|nr:uncharacterized protein LOC121373904 [Gigantopelta aegis]